MSERVLLIGGPREGDIVACDIPVVRLPLPPRLSVAEGDPLALPEIAEYCVDRLPEPEWDDGREYTAIGRYIEPPLKCGHSRDHTPFSVYVLNREEAMEMMRLPEYRNYFPEQCKECGLITALRAYIPIGQWAKWKRERVTEMHELLDWLATRMERPTAAPKENAS